MSVVKVNEKWIKAAGYLKSEARHVVIADLGVYMGPQNISWQIQ